MKMADNDKNMKMVDNDENMKMMDNDIKIHNFRSAPKIIEVKYKCVEQK